MNQKHMAAQWRRTEGELMGSHHLFAVVIIAALLAPSVHAAAPARPSMAEIIQGAAAATEYEETAISPNHRQVAYVQTVANDDGASPGSAIYVQLADHSTPPARVSAKAGASAAPSGAIKENSVAWAPDGASLAFLSDAESPGQVQLYAMRTADHSVRRLTQLKGNLATPLWSGDGTRIAILYTENSGRQAGPLVAVAAPTGVIDDQVLEQRLTIVDVAHGDTKVISGKDRYVYEFDWSPRGDAIVATAAYGPGDNNWYLAELITLDVATGAEHVLLKPKMREALPRRLSLTRSRR